MWEKIKCNLKAAFCALGTIILLAVFFAAGLTMLSFLNKIYSGLDIIVAFLILFFSVFYLIKTEFC